MTVQSVIFYNKKILSELASGKVRGIGRKSHFMGCPMDVKKTLKKDEIFYKAIFYIMLCTCYIYQSSMVISTRQLWT